jgi:hypothetical protein
MGKPALWRIAWSRRTASSFKLHIAEQGEGPLILRGATPAELPVQLPVKFVMALNIKTAKTLGLEVPPSVLLSAEEVIE